MKKQTYVKPTMDVVKVQANSIICTSPVGSVGGNVFNQPSITGGSGNARSNESGAEEVEGAEDLW